MLQQKFTVQVTTLPYCDDITRFDGMLLKLYFPLSTRTLVSDAVTYNQSVNPKIGGTAGIYLRARTEWYDICKKLSSFLQRQY